MKKSIYQLALRCKSISDEKMGTDRNIFPFKGIVFTDYTVKGPADEYLKTPSRSQIIVTRGLNRLSSIREAYRNKRFGATMG